MRLGSDRFGHAGGPGNLRPRAALGHRRTSWRTLQTQGASQLVPEPGGRLRCPSQRAPGDFPAARSGI
eukprot:7706915-Pyramimonas_sp.AAC.1